jgi:peptidyl-prolyl cis-trans isomerase C
MNRELKKENTVAKATARHILVSSQEACDDLKQQIENGKDFAEMAKEHSQCPSSQQGGDLGEFGPGQMVKEFDEVVFKEDVGAVHGPIQTQFGFHLVEITGRTD